MCIIKNAIKHNLPHIDSSRLAMESDPAALRQYYLNEMDWRKVEQEILKELKNEIVTDSVETDMLHEVITKQVQTTSDSEWFLNVIKRAQNNSSRIKYI